MSKRSFLLLASLASVGALSLAALPSCSNALSGCDTVVVLTLPTDSLSLFVGDSARVFAAANSACPQKIGFAVVFSSTDPTILGVRQVDDTTAVVRGVAPGLAGAHAVARDRTTVYSTIPVRVSTP
jgi:hypothetical protein